MFVHTVTGVQTCALPIFSLGDELDAFVRDRVDSGEYASASEVVRAALTQFADEQRKEAALLDALDRGVASGRARPGTFERIRKRYGWRK
jgi:antitoxin ParD1/3/4